MDNNNLTTVLAKEACPLCGQQVDGPILLDKVLRKTPNKELEELHGKCIGFMDEPCNDCKSNMEKGFLIVGIVDSKSASENPEDIYRSGNIWVIKEEVAKNLFGEEKTSQGAAFIDVHLANQLGLPDANTEA